jgi:hypothetical protein
VKKASSSMVFSHQNIGTRTNYTGCGGRVLGCSGFSAGSVASGCLNVSWAIAVYSSFLGADKVPPSLTSEAVMVILDRTSYSVISGGSPFLFDGGTDGFTGRQVVSGGPPGGDLEANRWS